MSTEIIETIINSIAARVAERLPRHEPDRLLTLDEAAERLAISRTKLSEIIQNGELLAVYEGKLKRVRLSTLLAYMDALERRAR